MKKNLLAFIAGALAGALAGFALCRLSDRLRDDDCEDDFCDLDCDCEDGCLGCCEGDFDDEDGADVTITIACRKAEDEPCGDCPAKSLCIQTEEDERADGQDAVKNQTNEIAAESAKGSKPQK